MPTVKPKSVLIRTSTTQPVMAWWCNDKKPHQMVHSYIHIHFSSQTVNKIASANVFLFLQSAAFNTVSQKKLFNNYSLHLHPNAPMLKHSSKYCYLKIFTVKFLNNLHYTGLSKKVDGIWNRYNLKSTGRIYTFGVLKCSEKFKVLDLP